MSRERSILALNKPEFEGQNGAMTVSVWLTSLIEKLDPAAMMPREVSAALFITRTSAVADVFISEGSISHTALPLRRILAQAEETNARQILLLHTHPSGNPRPSQQDIVVTRHFCGMLRRRNVRLMDHLILARDSYFSFRAHHML